MKAIVAVEMANAAFQPDWTAELGRILRELGERLERGYTPTGATPVCVPLRDINGNVVGGLKIKT